MSTTIDDLKKSILQQINCVPDDGVVDEHGYWTSQEDEKK